MFSSPSCGALKTAAICNVAFALETPFSFSLPRAVEVRPQSSRISLLMVQGISKAGLMRKRNCVTTTRKIHVAGLVLQDWDF